LGGALMLGKGERHNGGADRDTLLCAGFEALIGALYLQASLPAVQRFMQPFLNASQEQVLTGTNVYDAKSKLQEWTQAQKMGIPHYVVTAERGPDHAKTFVVEAHIDGKVYGTGSGQSKSAAAQAAAKATLDMLGID
jgi:ribonuclease-3